MIKYLSLYSFKKYNKLIKYILQDENKNKSFSCILDPTETRTI